MNPAFNFQQVVAALTHLEVSHLIISAETNLPGKPPHSNLPLLLELLPDPAAKKVKSRFAQTLSQVILVDRSDDHQVFNKIKSAVSFDSVLKDGESHSPLPNHSLHPGDIVNIQFTSGTTSSPKAACLTHRSILNNGNSIGDRMLLTEHDIVCCPPPLFHCFGSVLGYMATATHGSAIVFPSEAFDPYATLRSVQEEKCTALYGVPTMFLAELELLQNGTIPHTGFEQLRTGIAAGSSVPAELMRRLHKTLNLTQLTICYGMTETSPVSAMTTTDEPIERRINSVGKLLPHVEAKIVDPANPSKILPVGTKGELAISGYLLMTQYWGAPEQTSKAMIADTHGKIWMHVSPPPPPPIPNKLKPPRALPDRRRSAHRRRKLHHHHRPHQRPNHPRRRKYPPARNRKLPFGAPLRCRCQRRRDPGSSLWRGRGCFCYPCSWSAACG